METIWRQRKEIIELCCIPNSDLTCHFPRLTDVYRIEDIKSRKERLQIYKKAYAFGNRLACHSFSNIMLRAFKNPNKMLERLAIEEI
jgi:hypothetical protein